MTDPATTPPRPRQIGRNALFKQMTVIPHETTPPPRPRSIPGRGRGRVSDPAKNPPITRRFTANTCPACGAITISGLVLGIRLDLEPLSLTDHDECRAIADQVATYNLHPDLVVRLRGVAEIRSPSRHERHARHVCGTTYGTQPRTRTVTRTPIDHAEPPF